MALEPSRDKSSMAELKSNTLLNNVTVSTSKAEHKSKLISTLTTSIESPQSTAKSTAARSLEERQKRRKHKNSKLGCPNCKQRRVKCSEDLPSCANCIKHKVECGYLKYTKEELGELEQAKLERQQPLLEMQKSDSRSETDGTDQHLEIDSNNGSQMGDDSENRREIKKKPALNNSSKISKPRSKRKTSTARPRVPRNFEQQPDSHSMATSVSNTTSTTTSNGNLFDLDESIHLSSHSPTAIQNFDSLLPQGSSPESSIIYPIYKMRQGVTEQSGCNHISSSETTASSQPKFPDTLPPNALPGAIHKPTSFSINHIKRNINYTKETDELFKEKNPAILKGSVRLDVIKQVYWMWLKSFVYRGTSQPLTFYCLLNVCANYLTSNCFNDSYKLYSLGRAGSTAQRGVELAHMRQTCFVKSIHYYDQVVKRLRVALAECGHDPDASCTASYMLSLLSLYDLECSLSSTTCYREGLFDMLEHYSSKSVPIKRPLVVQIELKLMTNIMMTGNLPAYDPTFMNEVRQMLNAFGEILLPLCKACTASHELNHPQVQACHFIRLKYRQLLQFMDETIDIYIPRINNNMANLEAQQDLLYQVLTKWVIMFPSQLVFPTPNQGPFEKIMYLFFKLVKNVLFAIFPHVKFFFLRNFDGPILSDIYSSDDYAIYQEISQPRVLRVEPSLYEPHVNQLKHIAAYLIRVSTYIEKRFHQLYPVLMRFIGMYDFSGSHINTWRKSVDNIASLRKDFCDRMQVTEINMVSFTKGYLKKCNYPGPKAADDYSGVPDDTVVDFTTLLPSGLLAGDYDPDTEEC
ncbi:hypothetical protein CANMA_001367 [Candida margitis]|uniref:uncharacterized protein n=1 Tax=Candida margitis TaxID=1775924 RepID=UPI002226F7DB|nr:uncharacterized protein CANMA_001367 [Candida margitis]KAI5969704.1 hypothetical protein CANMA_001367 [Candida margitis]